MKQFYGIALLVTLWLIGPVGLEAYAQEFGRVGSYTVQGVPYKVFARVGEPTVQVYVVGSSDAGLYEVGTSVDLVRLFTFVGGELPAETGETRRLVTVRLYRLEGGHRTIIYEAPADELVANPDATPALQDGDVFYLEIIQEEKRRFDWRDTLRILQTVAGLLLLADRLGRLF